MVVRFFVRVRVIRHQAEGIQVGCDSFAEDSQLRFRHAPVAAANQCSHYGILGNNRRKRDIEAARAILKRHRRALQLQPLSIAVKS
jgi:hypothetical protein